MKKYIRNIAILLAFIILFLVSCEEELVYHYADAPSDDVAVMKPLDDNDSNEKKMVAITYDDGPHNIYTKKIVDELDKYGFNATFFVIGNRIDGTAYKGSSALSYAHEKGNDIGIHGYTHMEYYDKCSEEVYKNDLKNTEDAIKNVVRDASVRLMRPAWGRITNERVKESKYSIILWNVDTEDWKYKYSSDDTVEEREQKVQTIVDSVMNNVQDGNIILMHDIYESTYDATVIILQRLHEEGYEVVTVSELIGTELSAGKKFSHKVDLKQE